MIVQKLICDCCHFHQKVGASTGCPRLQAGVLFMDAKHPEPPHYHCTMHRVVLGSVFVINTKLPFTPMHVG